MPSAKVSEWVAELEDVFLCDDAATCLYHALYGRDGALHTRLATLHLPTLRAILASPSEDDFVAFVSHFFGKTDADSTALLLRSLYAWREHGALPDTDDAAPSWADVNDDFLDGELPSPEEYCQHDLETMQGLMLQFKDEWANRDSDTPVWVGINAAFGSMVYPSKLWHYCEMRDMHDVPTAEYVDALAARLSGLLGRGDAGRVKTVLEVGAGRGYLSKQLARRLRGEGVSVVATDADAFEGVEQLDCASALVRHAPDVVVCSWMPYGCDWTSQFRAAPSVAHYVLTGPPGLSGTTAAWCCPADGLWRAEHVEEAEMYSICKLDSEYDPGNTKTILYSRK
eukprot:Rhum_TRINITY_DN2950_c0_g2::Rhum_TRINITY_DN2950_c0_g2_i1::g.8906::m.8906